MRAKWVLTAAFLVLIAVGSYGLYAFLRPAPLPPQLLYGNGHIEGTEIGVAAEIAERVSEFLPQEGTRVTRGEVLARLDDDELRLRREKAKSSIEALKNQRRSTTRELEVARHHLKTAKTEVERNRELNERGTVSAQQLDKAENAFFEAQGRAASLEAQAAATDARIQVATRELELVDQQIGKTRIEAPLSGTVLIKAIEPGEFVQPGQTVAVLVDLSKMELRVFIPEKDIGKVLLNAPARVRVDAFPDRSFAARVARVDQRAQFTPRDIHMPEERIRTVFGVTLALTNPEGLLKPGMPADAWILWDRDQGWPERLFVPR